MIKTNYILLISLVSCYAGISQNNLVPNGSFEEYHNVPTQESDFSKVKFWFNPCDGCDDNYSYGTPDYFHMNGKGDVKIPFTKMGTIFAESGMACIGLISYTDNDKDISNFREYIAIKLNETLMVDEEYMFSISFSYGSDNQYGFYSTSSLGIGFSKYKPVQNGHKPLSASLVKEINVSKYEIDWITKELQFTADKEYNYLIIGNFKNDSDTNVLKSEISNSDSKFAYIFLDNISLKLEEEIPLADTESKHKVEEDVTSSERETRLPSGKIKTDTIEIIKEVQVEIIKEKTDTVEVVREVPVEIIKERVDTIEIERTVEVLKEITDTVEIIREVIKEVPVEIVKERIDTIEVIKEVIKEVPVEVIKTVEVSKGSTEIANTILKGEKLIIDIHFEADSFNIKKHHHFELNKIKNFLEKYSDIAIEIAGHTNSVPSHDYCDRLSNNRANAIREYLIAHGINSEQIIAKGYGKRKPIARNTTSSGRKMNQRVELKLSKYLKDD